MIERLTVVYDGSVGPVGVGGSGAYGVEIKKDDKPFQLLAGDIEPNSRMTQTFAEYVALLNALIWLDAQGHHEHHIRFHGRTLMIVNQMTGRWKAKTEDFAKLHAEASKLAGKFKDVGFDCVPREKTEVPRSLAEKVLTDRGIKIYIPTDRVPEEADETS